MDRYVGVDAHARSCTLGVIGPSGKRLKSMAVETKGQALVEAVRSISGRVHLCLEEGTQSAWLYELLAPHVEEVVVVVPAERKGPKDDLRDAWARAEELRTGAIQTRVYKAPQHLAALRNAVRAYGFAVRDVVRAKNRLKSVFLSRGIEVDAGVYEPKGRSKWLPKLPRPHRDLAEWLGQQLDGPVAATGGGGRVAAQRGQDTPDHPDALDGARDGNHPLGADGGRSGDPGAVPNASPVLELLGALHRDAIIGGLGTRQGRTIDALSRAPDSRPDAQAERPPQVGVQGSGHHGDCAVARRPAPHCVRARGAGGCEAQPGQAHAGSPHRRHRAVDVEEPGGVRPGSPSARDRQDAGAFVGEASAARCVFGDTAREGFEGEHPLVSWSPGRDGESPDAGYAPLGVPT
jgi:hypothetical protein